MKKAPAIGTTPPSEEPAIGNEVRETSSTEAVVEKPVTSSVTPAKGTNPLDGLASMPSIQPHAIAAAKSDQDAEHAQNQQILENAAGLVDPKGRAFDASLHEVDENGEPRLSPSGKLRCKRGRGASGFVSSGFKAPNGKPNTSQQSNTESAKRAEQTSIEIKAKIDSSAKVVTELIFTMGRLVGGEEWEPKFNKEQGIDERTGMTSAWREYFTIRGQVDLPPELMLAVTLGGYAVPRFFMPVTKSRFQKAKEWVYMWYARRKAGKTTEPRTVDAVVLTP